MNILPLSQSSVFCVQQFAAPSVLRLTLNSGEVGSVQSVPAESKTFLCQSLEHFQPEELNLEYIDYPTMWLILSALRLDTLQSLTISSCWKSISQWIKIYRIELPSLQKLDISINM